MVNWNWLDFTAGWVISMLLNYARIWVWRRRDYKDVELVLQIRKIVRERMMATTPADWKVMGEYDSKTLRDIEKLLYPPLSQ